MKEVHTMVQVDIENEDALDVMFEVGYKVIIEQHRISVHRSLSQTGNESIELP